VLEREIVFPEGFLWGAATAAHQIEGGNRNNDWWEWEQQPGRVTDGSRSGAAAEWWAGRAEDDLRRAAAMGHTAHRLSIEWSRLEPSPGTFDESAFGRYRTILGTMRDLGMTASVTLHHFTLPQWAARGGGWRNDELVPRFGRFAAESIRRLGDLVDWWATINEPMILVYGAYAGHRWPPGANSIPAGFRASANLLRAHHAAYKAGKAVAPDAPIGIVFNLPVIDPARPVLSDRLVARTLGWMMNDMMLVALDKGTLSLPLATRPEPLESGPGAVDWYGLNYYGRHLFQFAPMQWGTLFGREVQEGIRSETQSWGEIDPRGLTSGLLKLAERGKPLLVTESGIFDNRDALRPAYILRHVRATHEAIQRGADVRGFFHWTLVDNFEWAEGWSTRFGLIELNPVTQERRTRRSAAVYERVIRANGITPELWNAEVREEDYESR
jgi:beta-glucosidase